VGVDTTSQFPPEALKNKPNIGYVRALSAEGLLSLKPDRVIAIEGAGPPDVIKLVDQAKVVVRFIPEDYSEAGVVRRILMVGQELEAAAAAEALAHRVKLGFEKLAAARLAAGQPARVLFVLSLQNGRVMVGGRNTSADAIIRLAGGENAASTVDGFKPLSDEGIIAAAPDVVILMKRGEHALSASELFAHPAFRLVPAARTQALIAMDGLYLLGFGPRTPDAAAELMDEIKRVRSVAPEKQAANPQTAPAR
jgi:iron complex transport system substrate-binding protein